MTRGVTAACPPLYCEFEGLLDQTRDQDISRGLALPIALATTSPVNKRSKKLNARLTLKELAPDHF
jgi:hypothetical protein